MLLYFFDTDEFAAILFPAKRIADIGTQAPRRPKQHINRDFCAYLNRTRQCVNRSFFSATPSPLHHTQTHLHTHIHTKRFPEHFTTSTFPVERVSAVGLHIRPGTRRYSQYARWCATV